MLQILITILTKAQRRSKYHRRLLFPNLKTTSGYGGLLTVLDEGQITNIAVHPNFRGMGVGKAILEKLIFESESRGIREISLEVRQSNLPAKALYQSYGFEIAGVRKGFYRHPAEDGLVMILSLTNTPQT